LVSTKSAQDEEGESSWHLYVVQLRSENLRVGRDFSFDRLQEENIGI
jgi:perosamine synthetase